MATGDESSQPASITSTPEPNQSQVREWVEAEDYDRLERAVLKGKGAALIQDQARHYREMSRFMDAAVMNREKLHYIQEAIKEGNYRAVRVLVDRKKLALVRDSDGLTFLHIAINYSQPEIALFLIQLCPECAKTLDRDRRSPLHYAAALFGSSSDVYEALIEAGGDPKGQDKFGRIPEDYLDKPELLDDTEEEFNSLRIMSTISEEPGGEPAEEHVEYPDDMPTSEEIQDWMNSGEIEMLEQALLDGYGFLFKDKTSNNPETRQFLEALPKYQMKIHSIHAAVEEGDVRRVKSLIDRHKLATARDKHGAAPIHNAVLYGQTDTLRYLIQKYPQTINLTDYNGRTPLHYAAGEKNSNFVKILQKGGADGFIEDKFGHTPYFYQNQGEKLELPRKKSVHVMDRLMSGDLPHSLLQELERDITEWLKNGEIAKLEDLLLNGYGDLILGKVAEVESPDVLSFLEIMPQYQAKIRAIHRAVQIGALREVKSLTDRKKLALARDARGATPLHNAVLFEHEEIVKYFIKNYPQGVNALDHLRCTPLHYAAALKDGGRIYKMLRKAGANSTLEDANEHTPKYYLSHPNELDLEGFRVFSDVSAREQLTARAAPGYLETNIQTWLHDGNANKLEQLVLSGCGDLLEDRQASHPDARKFLESLPSMMERIDDIQKAVKIGDMKEVKRLIDRRRLAMARDRKGATPLHNAVLYGQTEVVRHLIKNYPQTLNAPDYHKRTPMHYAAAARDGGHQYKIMERAGGDLAVADGDGHLPEYYLRNPGKLDLQMIRDKDMDYYLDDRPLSGLSDLSESSNDTFAPTSPTNMSHSSALSSDEKRAIRLAAQAERNRQQDDVHSYGMLLPASQFKLLPNTPTGQYLARTVGPVLTKFLAEVVMKRPVNPLKYISDSLYKYAKEQKEE